MKLSSTTLLLTVSSSLISISGATGTLRLDIERRAIPISSSQRLRRRSSSSSVTVNLDNQIFLYSANVTVGTPPQQLILQLDTGSSDVWVPEVGVEACDDPTLGGCTGGTFDPTASSTFDEIGVEGLFEISYGDGTSTTGDYFKDTLGIGGTELTEFVMGLGIDDKTIPYGLAGIGFDTNEAIVAESEGTTAPHPNLIDAMVNASLVNSNAYSLWLDDLEASTGSILFGGIDTSKYSGDLIKMDILLTAGQDVHTDFNVAWTSLAVTSSSGTDNLTSLEFPMSVVLDSGSTAMVFPSELASVIFEEFGVTENDTVPCSLAQHTGTMDFGFAGPNGPTIKIPISELVTENPADPSAVFIDGPYKGQAQCNFLIQGSLPTDPGVLIFGDSFLRSAYVVYDLSNAQIALAQTVFNSTAKANVVPFASSGAPIPSAKEAVAQATAVVTATGNFYPTGVPSLAAEAGFTSTGSGSSAQATGGHKKSGATTRNTFKGIGIGWAACCMVGSLLLSF